jgi:hypothetical protein
MDENAAGSGNRMSQFSTGSVWRESTPSFLVWLALGMTVVGLGTWATWMWSGDGAFVNLYLRQLAPLVTVGVCLIEVGLCWQAWRSFDEEDAMRGAWLWLFLASVAHLAGRIMGAPGPGSLTVGPVTMNEIGRLVSGPLQMSLLFAGLVNIVQICRRMRILRRLTLSDYAMLAVVIAFGVRTAYGIAAFVSGDQPVTFIRAMLWTTDPMLLALVVMAILLHRSAAALGHGMLTNVWRSYVAGIFLTAVGSASAWSFDGQTHVWTSLGWYVWFAADSAYALAPAFQLAAVQHARNRARVFAAFGEAAFWRLP